ncbi:MAG: type II secretion system F family protein [Gemmatimonadetes bacterium]|nr:type II secretion system F family protein [Gemmatimonadota bacterium]
MNRALTAPAARRRTPRPAPRPQRGEKRFLGLSLSSGKVKARELASFSRELATLLESGIPVVSALETMAEQRAGRPLGAVIEAVVADLSAGQTIAAALSKHPEVFDRAYVRTVATSDRGAPLAAAVAQVADFLDNAESALSQAKKAMIYPVIVLTLGAGVTFVMMTVALPPMIGLLQNLKVDLPIQTRLLMALSGFLGAYKLPLAVGAIVAAFAAHRYLKTDRGRMALHRAMLRVPVVSRLVVQSDVARVSGALASLTEVGLPLPEALEVATETASNGVVRQALGRVRSALLAGDGFAAPMAAAGLFPPTFTQTLRVAEDTGTLDRSLRRMADYYKREATDTVKALVSLLEPLSTVVIALLVGFIAMAVIVPMYSALGSFK